jgi:hypothetical protein
VGEAKRIKVQPCARDFANALCRRLHYSHSIVRNSTLHFAVWIDGRPEGVLQFGPSMDKRKVQKLVPGTPWNSFLELNRMAFSDALPRNSESRAIAVCLRIIRKQYPHIQWIISYADGTQCGDGTIYRASGFVLTGIRKNSTIWELGDDSFTNLSARMGPGVLNRLTMTSRAAAGKETFNKLTNTKGRAAMKSNGGAGMARFRAIGAHPKAGHQLRYIYFLDPAARARLAVPILPFAEIAARGVGMYKGRATRTEDAIAGAAAGQAPVQQGNDGARPIHPLQNEPPAKCTDENPPAKRPGG